MSRLRGFTIIELLVVIAIISLLISILLPSLASARDRARYVKWQAFSQNLRIDDGLTAYFNFEQQGEGYDVLWNRAAGNVRGAVEEAFEPEDYNASFGSNASAVDAMDPQWNEGRWKGKPALIFDGNEQHLRHLVPLDKQQGSIIHWVLPKNSSSHIIFYEGDNPGGDGFGTGGTDLEIHTTLSLDGTLTRGNFHRQDGASTGNTDVAGPNGALQVDQWAFLVATWDRKDVIRLYVNGRQNSVSAAMSSFVWLDQPNTLGRIGGPPGNNALALPRFLDGIIDELGVFNRVLSAQEIEQMFNVGKARLQSP